MKYLFSNVIDQFKLVIFGGYREVSLRIFLMNKLLLCRDAKSPDCGIFAIAIVTCLCNGGDQMGPEQNASASYLLLRVGKDCTLSHK